MPVPVNLTKAANVTLHNATNATVAKTAAKAAATAGGTGVFDNIARMISNATGVQITGADVAAVVAMTIVAPLLILAVKRMLASTVGQPLTRRVAFLVYDSSVPALRFYVMTEIAPNVFATDDGKYVAFVSEKAQMINITPLPLDKKVKKLFQHAYYTHKIGSLLLTMEPIEEITLSILNDENQIRRLSDILIQLYQDRIVEDIAISPAMRLAIQVDPVKASEIVAKSYGRHAEESLISIVSVTGRRKEFEQHLRTILQMEKERLESISSAAIKIGLIIVIGMVAIAYVVNMFR